MSVQRLYIVFDRHCPDDMMALQRMGRTIQQRLQRKAARSLICVWQGRSLLTAPFLQALALGGMR
ncbi:MAG: hypothetical protein CMH69_02580 [Nitratireductor sp.]|nr:hypothetical protein [Nitratireductor sp.]